MCEGLILPLGDILSNLSFSDWVDIWCALAALISVGLGAHRGLSAELPSGVGWFCGVLAAWYAYAPLHSYYQGLNFMQNQPEMLLLFSLLTVGLLACGISILVYRGLRLLAVNIEKKPADYVLGTAAGLIRAFLLLLVATAIMLGQSWWPNGREVFCNQSRTGQLFTPWASDLLVSVKKLYPHIEIHRRTDDPGDLAAPPRR